MSDSPGTAAPTTGTNSGEDYSTLFAHLVVQQANMAMMLLGKVAHPETGQTVKDLDAARVFIDQLEMLQTKTKGNLTKAEDGLLKQSLMALQFAFVEAVDTEGKAPAARTEAKEQPSTAPPSPSAAPDEESRKKFSKKY